MTFRLVSQRLEIAAVDSIQPHPENPRRGNVDVIEESIDVNGFYGACVVQASSRRILAGEHRWKAARARGATELPVMLVDVDDATARRIVLIDNRANDLAGYDDAALAAALAAALEEDGGLDGTGYTESDLDLAPGADDQDDALDDLADRGLQYQVVIECDDEEHQRVLLERLDKEGLKCRPLML